MKLSFKSLIFKTLFILLVSSSIFISFITFSAYNSFSEGFKEIIQEDINSIKTNIVPAIALNLSFEFNDAINEIMSNQLNDDKIIFISIHSNKLTKNITFSKENKPLQKLQEEEHFISQTKLVDPATLKKIGTLTLVYSNKSYKTYMQNFYNWFIFSIIIFLFIILSLSYMLYNSLSQLNKLAFSLEHFNPDKPKEFSFSTIRTDEIGIISTAANKMVYNLINFIEKTKKLNQTIYQKEAHLKEAQRMARVGSWEYDLLTNTLDLSDEIYRILNLKLSTMITWQDFLSYIAADDFIKVNSTFQHAIEYGSQFELQYKLILQKNRVIYIKTKGKVRKKIDGRIKMTAVSLDITQEMQNKQTIEKLAYYDALTGLANRTLLKNRMHKAIQISKRDKTQLAVLFLDLDHFKLINDTLGHSIGDDLLIYLTKILKNSLRESDTLARIGGDEFIILLPKIQSNKDLQIIADKILNSLQNKHYIGTHELFITSSIGASIYPQHGSTSEELIKNADTAMYEAKNNGRNNFQLYKDSMGIYIEKRMHLEQDLITAVKNSDEIEIFYQAKIDAKTDTISGAEALVRWQHPTRGLIFPNDFIYIAESTGLMIELGEIIIEKTIAQIALWNNSSLEHLKIAINLSPRQFQNVNLVSFISQMIQKYNIHPSQLEFEITETLSMSNTQNTLRILNNLKEIGVSIAIDDFGTGHSSLAYLKKFPIDTLKIDQSFIKEITENEEDKVIVQTIISMSHSLGFKTVAEGVETSLLVNSLHKMGCDEFQGYYFSKPINKDAFTSFVKGYKVNT